MKPEEKDLLLSDLCARLPYEPVIEYVVKGISGNAHMTCKLDVSHIDELLQDSEDLVEIKPYLRPMSSMTEEEKLMFYSNIQLDYYEHYFEVVASQIEWLNAHHFDYRGLIDKGLAFEVTEEYNPYKE